MVTTKINLTALFFLIGCSPVVEPEREYTYLMGEWVNMTTTTIAPKHDVSPITSFVPRTDSSVNPAPTSTAVAVSDGDADTYMSTFFHLRDATFLYHNKPISRIVAEVRLHAEFKADGTGNTFAFIGRASFFIEIAGVQYRSTEFNFPDSGKTIVSRSWATNPATGQVWRGSDLHQIRGGVRSNTFRLTPDGTEIVQTLVYEHWIEVDHIQFPGSAVVLIRERPPILR